MMHSKWASGNPVIESECSSVKLDGSQGLWYSQNCSEADAVICMKTMNSEIVFNLPGLTETTTKIIQNKVMMTEGSATETILGQTTTQAMHGVLNGGFTEG